MKTIYIIEDQAVLRDFLCRLIEQLPDFELAGACGDGREAVDDCLRTRPNLLLLDVMLPSLQGTEVLRRVKRELTDLRVLGFSTFPTKASLRKLVEAGADGLVRKSESLPTLEQALNQVAAGNTYYSPEVTEMLRQMMLHPEQAVAPTELSTREREIIQLIAESNSNKDIAARLGISVKTAETHRNNIMRKLDIHDAVGLTRYAIAHGFVTADLYS
ncbi:MAG: LuxR C-terminal-related transcriptional regulator [Opitutales bacterium]